MKRLILLLVLLAGCGFPPPEGWVRFDEQPENQAMIQYVEDKVTDFMGVKPEWYKIWIPETDQDLATQACFGGQACNKFGVIIIHEDTDEYICQQLVHEMWHSGTYVQGRGWWVEPPVEYNTYMSETCRKYGNW